MVKQITKKDLIITEKNIQDDPNYLFDVLEDMIKDTWYAKTSLFSKIYRIVVFIDGTNSTNLRMQNNKANFYKISKIIEKHLYKYKLGDVQLFYDIIEDIQSKYKVNLQSFVSKFLFYFTSVIHQDYETFVIYDSVVREHLPEYTKIRKTNTDYLKYKSALENIKIESGIINITLRDVERHIWYNNKTSKFISN